jgi:poly-beta-1,6-N-acetyl-D-glucosamine synthase
MKCCVGITAFNEEANIGKLLEALLTQKTTRVEIAEILVVCSGCTDRTEPIVEEFMARDRRIKLLRQVRREGKASAVNLLLRHTSAEIIVLESADTIPLPETIEHMVVPFADPNVGMVGGRPVPTNARNTMMGFAAHLIWELHHQISLQKPKMGEIIAFRNIFYQIPYDSAVDEASIEPLIVGQGLRLHYAPEAVVFNRGPETLSDFTKQRRRIFAGHLYIKDTLGYKVSTMNGSKIGWLLLKNLKWDWRYFSFVPGIIGLEMWVRALGTWDYVFFKRKPYCWAMVESTKKLATVE